MKLSNKQIFWFLLAICVLTLIPFLGLAEYNTKGEPREAIVSLSMLESGDWILPRNNGGEMPYKPPFFHWCVAAMSMVTGQVTEFTSRMPSAIALIALVMSTFVFFATRKGKDVGLVTALICLLSMELHRAGGNCRVDMVLTALTVGAFYLMYRWHEKGWKGIPWVSVLLMGLGTLTKGPVGFVIPCVVMGGFLLVRKENIWKICGKLIVVALLSFVLPAMWYYAAYQRGGQEFYDLMYEENIGRMTHTMGYESCVEPWWFNFLTLTYGLVPFSLILVFGLFSIDWKTNKRPVALKEVPAKFCAWLTRLDDVTLFSLVAAVIIIVFYCIPQSKRSVYLMPMYPFLAYFIARFMLWLGVRRKFSLSAYNGFLSCAGLLAFVAYIVFKMRLVPDNLFSGRHAAENIATINAIGDIDSWWEVLLILIPTFVCGYWWVYSRVNQRSKNYVYFSLAMTIAIYVAVDGAYKNPALNVKSVKSVAAELQAVSDSQGEGKGMMYEYIEIGEKALGDPVHYFELNFYLHNKIGNFKKQKPRQGLLLIGGEDFALRFPDFDREGYEFFGPLYTSEKKVVGQTLHVYRFQR